MRRVGVLGVTLMVLHILFHVVECLILPSILVAFGGHIAEENVLAAEDASVDIVEVVEAPSDSVFQPSFCYQLRLTQGILLVKNSNPKLCQ